jgi:hypothetical protein
VLIFGTPYFGTKTPGSFFERNEYEGFFYIYLYPNGQKVKSCRVPALISSSVETDEYDDDFYSWREYRIQYAQTPNGDKIKFDNSIETLKLNKIVELYDDNSRYWGVQLTDKKVKKIP